MVGGDDGDPAQRQRDAHDEDAQFPPEFVSDDSSNQSPDQRTNRRQGPIPEWVESYYNGALEPPKRQKRKKKKKKKRELVSFCGFPKQILIYYRGIYCAKYYGPGGGGNGAGEKNEN